MGGGRAPAPPSPARGRFLGRNSDKSLKSFPPCYSQSPLQLYHEIYHSSNSHPLSVSTVQLLYTVKEKGGKPDRKPYPLPYGLRNPYRNLKSENSQDYAHKPQVCSWSRLLGSFFHHDGMYARKRFLTFCVYSVVWTLYWYKL